MRLLFEIARDDNPRLYDDLVRFNKGTRRVNRLRFLAHEGLLAQNWLLVAPATAPMASPIATPCVTDVRTNVARHTLQAFDAPAAGDED
jgi:hypothetical protein